MDIGRIEGLKELPLRRNDVIGLLPPTELMALFLISLAANRKMRSHL